MGDYTVMERKVIHEEQIPHTYTTEQLRALFGPNTIVWVLLERIEQLEKELDFYFDKACNGTPEATGTWIRYEQIDAAWRSIAHDDLKGPWYFASLDMLQILGIERCGRCVGNHLGKDENGEKYVCPNCNGKGWTVK